VKKRASLFGNLTPAKGDSAGAATAAPGSGEERGSDEAAAGAGAKRPRRDASATEDKPEASTATPTTPAAPPASEATEAATAPGVPTLRMPIAALDAAASEDKGKRQEMEDRWVITPNATTASTSQVITPRAAVHTGGVRCFHAAIYDGHGGRRAADYAATHLHDNVLAAGFLPGAVSRGAAPLDRDAAKRAVAAGFRATDAALLALSEAGGWQDGATAVCAWVVGNTVLVGNIGDAKAVLAREAPNTSTATAEPPAAWQALKGITLTRDHKAIASEERRRIERCGGFVAADGRLLVGPGRYCSLRHECQVTQEMRIQMRWMKWRGISAGPWLRGRLEVSRSFGDRQFKTAGVTSVPDVRCFDLTPADRFMLLGRAAPPTACTRRSRPPQP